MKLNRSCPEQLVYNPFQVDIESDHGDCGDSEGECIETDYKYSQQGEYFETDEKYSQQGEYFETDEKYSHQLSPEPQKLDGSPGPDEIGDQFKFELRAI